MGAQAVFEWGVAYDDRAADSGVNRLVTTQSTMGAVCRCGGLADGEEYLLGEGRDTLNFRDPNDPNVFIAKPTRELYMVFRKQNLASGAAVGVRFIYDIVSLTTAEQAALCCRC